MGIACQALAGDQPAVRDPGQLQPELRVPGAKADRGRGPVVSPALASRVLRSRFPGSDGAPGLCAVTVPPAPAVQRNTGA